MSFPPDLRALLEPGSIAIVGASNRPGPSARVFASLIAMGFSSEILAVNPGREHALGRPCAPSLSAIGRFLASPSGATFGGVEMLVGFAEEINPVRLVAGQGAPVILDTLIATRE